MTESDYHNGMMRIREWLHSQGEPADDKTDEEIVTHVLPQLCMAAAELSGCTLPVASWDKRFVRNVCGLDKWTPKQAITLLMLRHKYRRQIRPGKRDLLLDPKQWRKANA